jgi:Family of unknown function (DUF5681)
MNSPKKHEPGYLVGYGRPPRHSRFKKGQSGNPSGHRRYTETFRARQLAGQELNRKLTVREDGKTVRMSALQAIMRKSILLAAQGNVAAIKEVFKLSYVATGTDLTPGHATVSWQDPAHPIAAEPIHKITRVIVDPGQPTDLTKLTDEEREQFERLLEKAARKSR